MHPRQIENHRDISHKMIVRNDIIEMKLIEQLALITLQPPHHRKTPAAARAVPTESVFEVEGNGLLQQNRHIFTVAQSADCSATPKHFEVKRNGGVRWAVSGLVESGSA